MAYLLHRARLRLPCFLRSTAHCLSPIPLERIGLLGRSIDRSIDWSVGWSVGWLVGWVVYEEGCKGGGCSHIHCYQSIKSKELSKSVFGHSDGPPCPCVWTARLPTVGDRWLLLPRPRSRQRWHGALGGFQGANEKSSRVFPRGEDEVRAEKDSGFLEIAEEGHLAKSP